MSAVAAVWTRDRASPAPDLFRRFRSAVAPALADGGTDWPGLWLGGSAPGAARYPANVRPGWALRAAGRVDDRETTAARLGLDPRHCEDGDILAASWHRWGHDLALHVIGDWVLLASDGDHLWAARARQSALGLHARRLGDALWLAHGSAALCALGEVQPDWALIARRMHSNDPVIGTETAFAGIERLEPGGWWRFDRRLERIGGHCPVTPAAALPSLADAGEAMAELLHRATRDRLRRASGGVALELTAGRDSSAVAWAAARQAGDVLALTGAPAPQWPAHPGEDESAQAAATASALGIGHRSLWGEDADRSIALLGRYHDVQDMPQRGLDQWPWEMAVRLAAQQAGASVLLRGGHGNMTVSAGGPQIIADALREQGWRGFIHAGSAYAGTNPRGWATMLHLALGHRVPAATYARWADWRHPMPAASPSLLTGPLAPGRTDGVMDRRPLASLRAIWAAMAAGLDHDLLFERVTFGLDVRDPTADVRLYALVLGQPAWMFLGRHQERPLYRAAFADKLPEAVVSRRHRGHSGGDWPIQFNRAALHGWLDAMEKHPLVEAAIDCKAVRLLIDRWPGDGPRGSFDVMVQILLNTLSLGDFLSRRF
jgi:asparagine synthase (glutamine-hydrolysing)